MICERLQILKVHSVPIHWDKTQMLKDFSSDKINGTKKALFFLQLTTVLLLICDFYMSWSTSFVSIKLCVRFSIFDSVSFLLKFIILFNVTNPFKIKMIERSPTVFVPDLWFLNYKTRSFKIQWYLRWVGALPILTWWKNFTQKIQVLTTSQ